MDQTRREHNKKVLDRIASDPQFREELLDDPKGAMERAGLKWEGGEGDEVTGYGFPMTIATGDKGGSGISDMITCTAPPETGGSAVTAAPGGSTVGSSSGNTTTASDPLPK